MIVLFRTAAEETVLMYNLRLKLQLIRDGQMTREEVFDTFHNLLKHEGEVPYELDDFMNFFGLKKMTLKIRHPSQRPKSSLHFR